MPLTSKKLQLFQKLYEDLSRIVTTSILCETICGEFWQGCENTCSAHIRHLRKKIEKSLQAGLSGNSQGAWILA